MLTRSEPDTLLTMDDAVFQRLTTEQYYADIAHERRERFGDMSGSPRSAEDVIREAAAKLRKRIDAELLARRIAEGDYERPEYDADHAPWEGGE